MRQLRRRMRTPRPHARSLPGVRNRLQAMRGGVWQVPGCNRVATVLLEDDSEVDLAADYAALDETYLESHAEHHDRRHVSRSPTKSRPARALTTGLAIWTRTKGAVGLANQPRRTRPQHQQRKARLSNRASGASCLARTKCP